MDLEDADPADDAVAVDEGVPDGEEEDEAAAVMVEGVEGVEGRTWQQN